MDCLFCKIAAGEIPSARVYEDDEIVCFRDINPQAAVHLLVVPKKHVPSAAAVTAETAGLIGHIFEAIATKIAVGEEFRDGFRVVTNAGKNGCQSVPHIHFHVLAGQQLSERMG